jgi:PAP2 superfamily
VVLLSYALYEATRGLVAGDEQTATRHAHDVVGLERSIHLAIEQDIQRAAYTVPGLIGLFGAVYLTFHLAVTGGYLLWLHRRRQSEFSLVRTTLLLASALALFGYLLYPTAPPRLAGIGIADTVSNDHIDLNRGLLSSLYNPLAAVPSMHFGYALVVGASLLHCGRRVALRIGGAVYPALVLLVIVATGNHFLFDAAAGALVVAVAYVLTAAVESPWRTATPGDVGRLAPHGGGSQAATVKVAA